VESMAIDKIGPVNNYNNLNKVNKTGNLKKTDASDSVNISKEASELAENSKILEIVKNAPDVRIDRINELKAKINDPDYINNAIKNGVADKIMDSFGIK
jgi:negative regulator of flagellin synthesis FlgM